MHRLRRLYFDSIGVAENRFSDQLIELTDVNGEPADSIVWLRNGAGKTTMLSLLLALILPDRRDFLATRIKKRTLEDLVLGTDTSHVVAEWVAPNGQVLLTGAVYEWDGRSRPRDYNGAGKDKLKRTWWCLSPDPAIEGSTLEELPFTYRTGGRCDRDGFRQHIRALTGKGANAAVTGPQIKEWHTALRQRDFDPELFAYFTEVNAAEGGMDGLFSEIDSAGAFVRYLLRFAADKKRVAPVRDLLGDTAVEIAKRPIYLAEQEFCREARPKLDQLAAAQDKVVTSSMQRDEARDAAAAHKRAVLDASAEATARSEAESEKYRALDERHREARASVVQVRRRRDEYLRLAAVFRVERATEAVRKSENAVARLSLEIKSWEALEEFLDLRRAEAVLKECRRVLDETAKEAEPLVRAVKNAQSRLACALDTALSEATEQLNVLAELEEIAREDKAGAEDKRRRCHAEQVELNADHKRLSELVSRFQTARADAVQAGHLASLERLDAAAVRLRDELENDEQQIESHTGEQKRLEHAVRDARGRLEQARPVTSAAQKKHRGLTAELDLLIKQATRISDSPRLRAVLQTEAVDLLAGSAEAVTALQKEIATAAAAALDARAAVAEDERTVDALRKEGLLPARRAVAEIVQKLADAKITAHPGWHYLAHHVAESDRLRRISEHPEIADGVVVYGDPATIAATVDHEPDEVVVIAPVTALHTAGEQRVVLGPAQGRYDLTVAAAELQRRSERCKTRTAQLAEFESVRADDEALLAQIRSLTGMLPPDGVPGLRRRVELAEEAAGLAEQAEVLIGNEIEQLTNRKVQAAEKLSEARDLAGHHGRGLRMVEALAVEEREHVHAATARIEAIPGLVTASEEVERQANDLYTTADDEIERLRAETRSLEHISLTWKQKRAPLPDATSTDMSIEAAGDALAVAEHHLREQFDEHELRRAVESAQERVSRVAGRWHSQPVEVRDHAEKLAERPTAEEERLRAESLAQAQSDLGAAQNARGAASTEHDVARQELKAATPGDRARHTEHVDTPAHREDALRLAAEATEEASLVQTTVGTLEKERADAEQNARTAKSRSAMLRDQAERLRGVEPRPAGSAVLPREDDEIRVVIGQVATDLDAAESSCNSAMSARSQRADSLRTWAAQDRFGAVADDENGHAVRRLRELFRTEHLADRVATRAAEYVDDLAVREQRIGQQLVQVETHKNNVVHRLVDLVDESLSLLGRASRLSELPEGIGPWAGSRFLNVVERKRPTHDQVKLRVGELVDRMVQGKKIELDAVELLWRAVEASVIEGFRATVLKPAPDQPTSRTPVEEMRKWSGGENLTASLVLFCVMAKLRAEQHLGTRSGAVGGVVPLDNPLGKANYLPFLELQRKVAAASGVQLVFWTGLGDIGAVTAFPRIVAMHKRPSATRPGRAYVRSDPDNSFTAGQVVDAVGTVRDEP